LRFLLPALVVFTVFAPIAKGEEQKDVLRRLMSEPVTLFDWGLANLNRDIERAAMRVMPSWLGPGAQRPQTGTIYNWRANQITLYVSVAIPRAQRTRQTCMGTFREIVSTLTEGAPSGPNAAGWYLRNAFQPSGHFWSSRFEDVGAKLSKRVQLEISFLPATFESMNGDTRRISCLGRLNAEPNELTFDEVS